MLRRFSTPGCLAVALFALVVAACSGGKINAPPPPDTGCSDATKNNNETDVDCGGPACDACADGLLCLAPTDCASSACVDMGDGTKRCKPVHCVDAERSGDETDVDCGGSCVACGDGSACTDAVDCVSNTCVQVVGGKICVPATCTDSEQNGDESGVDCGGACAPCPEGGDCDDATDCESGVCAEEIGWAPCGTNAGAICACQPPACDDEVENGDEKGIDCGGSCFPCEDASDCEEPGDCQSGVCLETSGGAACGTTAGAACACAAATCSDTVQNNHGDETTPNWETDVDCGGPCGATCTNGDKCVASTDCLGNNCDGGYCLADHCVSGDKNGDETDVDCGGSCAPCADNFTCAEPSDCQSGVCTSTNCDPALCTDTVQNGDEADVDCGGTCDGCAAGSLCGDGADCLSLVCTESDGDACAPGVSASCRCQIADCFDGVENNHGTVAAPEWETDIDCGGPCTGCAATKDCLVDDDCESSVCAQDADQQECGTTVDAPCSCMAPACNDQVHNGDETGLDCGGSCFPCADGIACLVGDDCVSGVCTQTADDAACGTVAGAPCACTAPTCADAVRNNHGTEATPSWETDVDCGGPCGATCANGDTCVENTDCVGNACSAGFCVADHCGDTDLNGDETATDCGGSCAPCVDGSLCKDNSDCTSNVCEDGAGEACDEGDVCTCQAPDCADNTLNGTESAIDCGGDTCAPCAAGSPCTTTTDCVSTVCEEQGGDACGTTAGSACQCIQASCVDTIRNNHGTVAAPEWESDVDCGGPCGATCVEGNDCTAGEDCTTNYCDVVCRADHCGSAETDGDETDLNCGGSCEPCADTLVCKVNADCQSEVCRDDADGSCEAAESCTCQVPTCTDGAPNGSETDVDCGGTCPDCAHGDTCVLGSDCASDVCKDEGGGACDAGDTCTCQVPSCTDTVRNNHGTDAAPNWETDVDCGGPCVGVSPLCADGQSCVAGTDCVSSNCQGDECVPDHCLGGGKDGDETDVNCGGSCEGCADGLVCLIDADCQSEICRDGAGEVCDAGDSCTCQAPACDDGKKNSDETDVDCGGSCVGVSPLCDIGDGCAAGTDCVTGVCDTADTLLCLAPTCFDTVLNGDEKGADCGGSCVASAGKTCPDGTTCSVPGDCTSGVCEDTGSGLQCQAPACDDAVTNGDETDLNCGGTCPACADEKNCLVDTDCQSEVCRDERGETCDVGDSCTCQAPACDDTKMNGDETDVDCGGSCVGVSELCADGEGCLIAADCTSVNCRGRCSDDNSVCELNSECTSDDCASRICVSGSCLNGAWDEALGETDEDCGGGACPACADTLKCLVGTDCISKVCADTGGGPTCQAPACDDDQINGDESDLNCGGATCDGCVAGKNCYADSDCESSVCRDAALETCDVGDVCTCQARTCTDATQNGDESDVDCGGSTSGCRRCVTDEGCDDGSDCMSLSCDTASTQACLDATCADSIKNNHGTEAAPSWETDVDCGGVCVGVSPLCVAGKLCAANTDCYTELCDVAGTGRCQAATCSDGVENDHGTVASPDAETDIDCGGPCVAEGKLCDDGEKCINGTDCVGGVCDGGFCMTPVAITAVDPAAEHYQHASDFVIEVFGDGFTDDMGAYMFYSGGGSTCAFGWNAPGDPTPPAGWVLADGFPADPIDGCADAANQEVLKEFDCSTASVTCRVMLDAESNPSSLLIVVPPNASRPQGDYTIVVTSSAPDSDATNGVDIFRFVATPPPTVTAVNPQSAYQGSAADNELSDRSILLEGSNFLAVPTVEWINVNKPSIVYEAPYVEYLSSDQISAIVPSESQGMPIGYYALRVTNPGGQAAYWMRPNESTGILETGLFRITDVAPPTIDSIDPVRATSGEIPGTISEFHIYGAGFQDGASVTLIDIATDTVVDPPVLGNFSYAENQIDADFTLALAQGEYEVVVANPDGQEASYYSLAITQNAFGKLNDFGDAEDDLVTARAQMDGTEGFDDLGNGYLYVGGGVGGTELLADILDGDATTLFDTVEFAQVSYTGTLGTWKILEQTSATGVRSNNTFNTPRTGLQMLRVGRFIYAIGGRDTSGVLQTTERAEILTMSSSPAIQWARAVDPATGDCGGLELLPAGTYYYRVAAVTDRGEGMASRAVVVNLDADACVEVQWEVVAGNACSATNTSGYCPPEKSCQSGSCLDDAGARPSVPERLAATAYIIYRSTSSDAAPQSEQYLHYVTATAAAECKRPDGTGTGASSCQHFYDNGDEDLAPAPGNVRPTLTAGGGLVAGCYAYRVSTRFNFDAEERFSGRLEVAQLGADDVAAGDQTFTLAWDAVPDASSYCVYRSDDKVDAIEEPPASGTYVCPAAASTAEVYLFGATPSAACTTSTTFTDDGAYDDGDPVGTDGIDDSVNPVAPSEYSRLARGSVTAWEYVADKDGVAISLNEARWDHEALPLQLEYPADSGTYYTYIFAVGGRNATGVSVDSLRTTERVQVLTLTGDFLLDVDDTGAHWSYEVDDRSGSFACDAPTPNANCILLDWGRAYFVLMTNHGRMEQPRPSDIEDPCAIPDRDNDGYNSLDCGGTDCDDDDSEQNPGAEDRCVNSEKLHNCEPCCLPADLDIDGDGFVTEQDTCCDPDVAECDCCDTTADSGLGCASADPGTVYPGAPEVCDDGIDQDCDGSDLACVCPSAGNCACCFDGSQQQLDSDTDSDGCFEVGTVCCDAGCQSDGSYPLGCAGECQETTCTPYPPAGGDCSCCADPAILAVYDPDEDGYFIANSPCCEQGCDTDGQICTKGEGCCESEICIDSPWPPTPDDCGCCTEDSDINVEFDKDQDGLFLEGSLCCVPTDGCNCEPCEPWPAWSDDTHCCQDPAIVGTVDRDGDDHYYDDTGASDDCCDLTGKCDCCDSGMEASLGCSVTEAPNIYFGAPEQCGDGIDQDCNGSDVACVDCDQDGDFVDSDNGTCTGTDCVDDWDEYCALYADLKYCRDDPPLAGGLRARCDGDADCIGSCFLVYDDCLANTQPTDGVAGYRPMDIRPGVLEDFNNNCGDGIDHDCAGGDFPFCDDASLSMQVSPEPIYLIASQGSPQIDASGDECDVDDATSAFPWGPSLFETATIENADATRLGHIVVDVQDPDSSDCVQNDGGTGTVYTVGPEGKTCVRGWEPDRDISPSTTSLVATEGLLLADYFWFLSGGETGSGCKQPVAKSGAHRLAFCPYVSCFPTETGACSDAGVCSDTEGEYDINEHLIDVQGASPAQTPGVDRMMYSLLRLFSRLFLIGGYDSAVLDDVEKGY